MKKLIAGFLLLGLIFISFSSEAAAFFAEKFEPADGRIIHGVGQYINYYYNDAQNWNFIKDYETAIQRVPLILSAYTTINPNYRSLAPSLANIVQDHQYPYVLLVGLAYFTDFDYHNNPSLILSGQWDEDIRIRAREIKALNMPVFVRPGWEFGINNAGIHSGIGAADFKAIWIRIYDIFVQEEVTNAAWVWNTVNPNQFNYNAFYPGDTYVDWWGINWFTVDQMNTSSGFITEAANHQKPVIICESNPIQNNGTDNSQNWDWWFIPYFNHLNDQLHPNIKAFVYISNPWTAPDGFQEWPNSQIGANEYIRANYAAELTNPKYIHMLEYLTNPGVINGGGALLKGNVNRQNGVNTADALLVLDNWRKTSAAGYFDAEVDSQINGMDFGWVVKDWSL